MIRAVIILFFAAIFIANSSELTFDQSFFANINKTYGAQAVKRFQFLQKIIDEAKNLPEKGKLQVVNDFFNKVPYLPDSKTWGVDDYWATRVEFLGRDAGDCEDYAIAKYFTLKELGVPSSKLYITYTKSKTYKVAHMVLTYFETPKSIPLVLDNYNLKILPATQRDDLVPVYSFNGDELFLSKQQGLGNAVPGGMEKNKKWDELMNKMKGGK